MGRQGFARKSRFLPPLKKKQNFPFFRPPPKWGPHLGEFLTNLWTTFLQKRGRAKTVLQFCIKHFRFGVSKRPVSDPESTDLIHPYPTCRSVPGLSNLFLPANKTNETREQNYSFHKSAI